MTIQSDRAELPIAICKALGIDPGEVRKVVLTFEVGHAAVVKVDQYVTREEDGRLAKVIKTTRWQHIEAPDFDDSDAADAVRDRGEIY